MVCARSHSTGRGVDHRILLQFPGEALLRLRQGEDAVSAATVGANVHWSEDVQAVRHRVPRHLRRPQPALLHEELCGAVPVPRWLRGVGRRLREAGPVPYLHPAEPATLAVT